MELSKDRPDNQQAIEEWSRGLSVEVESRKERQIKVEGGDKSWRQNKDKISVVQHS